MNGGSQDVGNVVETRKGRFEGASLSEEGRVVRTFKGIPCVAPRRRVDPSA